MKTKTLKLKDKPLIPQSVSKQKPITKIGEKRKMKKVMDEWKQGELKTNAGQKVTEQKQAVAIALSESGQGYKGKKVSKK